MTAESNIRCVADVHAVLGEGPVWVERESALYWVDIKGRKIFRLGEDEQLQQWETPLRVGSLVPRASGGFIGGTEDGIAIIDPEAGRFEIIEDPEPERATNRFNDGKVDRSGRFWAGSMDDTEADATGALYRMDVELAWTRIDDGYKVTNGPAFSPLGDLMYHNDSARQVTYVFDLDRDGTPSNRRVFLQFGEGDGYPDGMTVDSEGHLWIAFWDGWCVRRFSPGGECVATIGLPVARPTSCAFGGPELDQLYISSASIDLDPEALAAQPSAGGLFMAFAGVRGIADVPFAG
jgi:sugar lactone lactonase YvrE